MCDTERHPRSFEDDEANVVKRVGGDHDRSEHPGHGYERQDPGPPENGRATEPRSEDKDADDQKQKTEAEEDENVGNLAVEDHADECDHREDREQA